jgi:hypothetical protein
MPRLLLASLIFAAACGSSSGRSASTTPSGGNPPDGMVCNDEVVSPRGTAMPRCYTRRQLDDQKRFSKDVKLDPTPRQTYNN